MKAHILKEIKRHLKAASVAAFIIFLVITVHVAFNGGVNKIMMNTYTLSNGEKTVVYQSMIHVGLKSFYKDVEDDIEHYRKEGYAIFFEGIGGTHETPLKENDEGYEKAVELFRLQREIYRKKYIIPAHVELKDSPYTLQAYEFFDSYKYGDKIADISYYEFINKIRDAFNIPAKQTASVVTNKTLESNKVVEDNNRLTSLLGTIQDDMTMADDFKVLNDNPSLFIYLSNTRNFFAFRFFENYIDPFTKEFIPSLKIKTDVIIKARDQHLVKEILASENKKIYVSYGEGHFKGVLKELQEKDSNWKIINSSEKIAVSQ